MAQIGSTLTAESGDTSEFTSVTEEGTCDISANNTNPDTGTYAFRCLWDGTNESVYGLKTFSNQSEAWLKARIRIDSTLNWSSTFRSIRVLGLFDGSIAVFEMGISRRAGSVPEAWYYYDRTNTQYPTTNFSRSEYHTVKMQFIKGTGADGVARLWIDGDLAYEKTDLNFSAYDIDGIRVGGFSGNSPDANSVVEFDNIEIWDTDPDDVDTYTLIYDGNDETSGDVPVDASSPYAENATVTVLGNSGSLAKTGYLFSGWNTAADGSGTHYDEDDTFSMPAENTVLYAEWTFGPIVPTYVLSETGCSYDTVTGLITKAGAFSLDYTGYYVHTKEGGAGDWVEAWYVIQDSSANTLLIGAGLGDNSDVDIDIIDTSVSGGGGSIFGNIVR